MHNSNASGGEHVKIKGCDGSLETTFNGKSGTYDLSLFAQDETDGKSMLKVYIDGELVRTLRLDQQSDGRGSDQGGFSETTLGQITIENGDKIRIEA